MTDQIHTLEIIVPTIRAILDLLHRGELEDGWGMDGRAAMFLVPGSLLYVHARETADGGREYRVQWNMEWTTDAYSVAEQTQKAAAEAAVKRALEDARHHGRRTQY